MSGSLHLRNGGAHRPLLPWLCYAVLWLGGTAPAHAEEHAQGDQTAPREKVEQIVITGTRRELPISQVPLSLSVLDQETLALDQARDVAELLREVPSFSLIRTGSRGGTSSAFVRGGESDHNLILVDGVQVNRGGGTYDLSHLFSDGLERIEVVRGPASALYGSDAVASVIQLVTRRGEGPMNGAVRALYGSDGTYEIGASLLGGSDRVGYSIHAGRYATDGLSSLNNDADTWSFRTRLDYQPSESVSVRLTASQSDDEFNFPTDFVFLQGFPAVDPSQGQKTRELASGLEVGVVASERVEHRFNIGWTDAEDIFFDPDDGVLVDGSPIDFGDAKSRNKERRLSGEYRLLWDASILTAAKTFVTLGLEYERETFDASDRFAAGIDEDRRTSSTYLQTDWTVFQNGSLSLGARLDDNSKFGTELSPSGALAWSFPASGTRVHASAARGIKAPTFGENLGFPCFSAGNHELATETSKSGEIGVEQSFWDERGTIALTSFRTDYDRLISFVSGPMGALGQFQNVQDVRSQGTELELRLALTERIRFQASYTSLRTRTRDPGAAESLSFMRDEELLRRPTHSGAASLAYAGERFEGRLSATFLGARADRDDRPATPARIRNDDFVKVDLSGSYLVASSGRSAQTRLLVRIENLFDEEYEEAFGFESAGFQILAGVELRF